MLQKLLTPQNVRRFHALIAAPLLMMSAVSNFYFFAGMSVGNHFMWRLFAGVRFSDIVYVSSSELTLPNMVIYDLLTQWNLDFLFLESKFSSVPPKHLQGQCYVILTFMFQSVSYLVPQLYVQIEHKLACCCHFNYFELVISGKNWFLVIVSYLLYCCHEHLLFLGLEVAPVERSLVSCHWRACVMTVFWCIWHSEDRASWYILIIKPTRCTDFSNLFLE